MSAAQAADVAVAESAGVIGLVSTRGSTGAGVGLMPKPNMAITISTRSAGTYKDQRLSLLSVSELGCAVDLKPEGGFVGAQAGFNHVFDNGLMLGVEGDYAFASLNDGGKPEPASSTRTSIWRSINWRRSGPGWAWQWGNGFPSSRLAGAEPRPTVQPSIPLPGSDRAPTATGTMAGPRALWHEYAIDDKWSVKAEYRYYDLGKENYGVAAMGGGGTDVDLEDLHTVLVGH